MERDRKGSNSDKPASARVYERARGGEARMIGDLMPAIGRTAFRRFGFVQSSVVTRWPEIIGAAHARHCAPESIRFPVGEKSEGTLHLVVSPAHAPIIQHVVPEIIERVNRFFGYRAVAQVRMRQGAVQAPRAAEPKAPPPSLKPVPLELGDSLRDVGDPELRAVLESLARSLERASADRDKPGRKIR
ncbi:DUF721 domain-containing protein [Novosphingobium sp. FSW06-99]|uniref:DUF721 domain-containing protein n=1 Tax=Novosphingobium sp. FSW06-99 TaxID=1739113 RepID=UPI00076DA6F5|nr:DUF721 domain-containing protein [Novosphingobium sp. FSW06-99]KUR80257.1 hypothetical protein AQZ49_02760 [Novosphingobium sp. FSW06-99]